GRALPSHGKGRRFDPCTAHQSWDRAMQLFHNSRCSKSRGALELLRERGLEPELVHYLDTPPTAAQLRELLRKLGLPARALLRTGEPEYAELGLADPALDDAALVAAMAAHPRLIERPVFVNGD